MSTKQRQVSAPACTGSSQAGGQVLTLLLRCPPQLAQAAAPCLAPQRWALP